MISILLLYYIALYYIILHYIILYYIILYYIILYYIILYYIILYYIILYYIILYYIILYYIILYYIGTIVFNFTDVHAELAIVATALPVLLTVSPDSVFNFGDCPLNDRVDTMCTIMNQCNILPVTYQFRRIAHFRAHPSSGKINPGETQNIIFSFNPKQIGKLWAVMVLTLSLTVLFINLLPSSCSQVAPLDYQHRS